MYTLECIDSKKHINILHKAYTNVNKFKIDRKLS